MTDLTATVEDGAMVRDILPEAAGNPPMPVASFTLHDLVSTEAGRSVVRSLLKEMAGNPPVPVASFTLPAPPSVNQMYKNLRRGGRAKTKAAKDWHSHASWKVNESDFEQWTQPCVGFVGVERHSLQADIDNTCKAIGDLMVDCGVIKDDSLFTGLFPIWSPPANRLCRIQIYPCQPMTLTFIPSQNGASGAVFINAPSNLGDDHGFIA